MLQKHFGVLVSELDWCSIGDLLTELKLDPFFVIHMLLLDSFLKHFELVLESNTLYGCRGVLNWNTTTTPSRCSCIVLHICYFSNIHSFLFAPVFSHWIVPKFRDYLENHIPVVGNLRMVQL